MSTSLSPPTGFNASELVFNDGFSGAVLNSKYWNTYMTSASTQGAPWDGSGQGGSGVGGVNDADYFESSQDSVSNGLTITAAQSSVLGANYVNGQIVSQTFPVTSGVVDSYGKVEFDGGYIQINMKQPVGDGSWPGLWLLPGQGAGDVGNNYEIDIQEGGYTDGSANPNDVFAYHLHTPSGTFGGEVDTGIDLTAGFNTYGLNWVPGQSLTWYLDGKEIAQITSAEAPVPDEPMALIMDEQVGTAATSGWRTALDGSTPQSMAMQVADVQLYQQPGGDDTVTAPQVATSPPAVTVAPTITAVTETPSNGDLGVGKTVTITLAASEAVTISGAPTLTLNDGGTATYDAAHSTATSLAFDYTVGAGDSSLASLAVMGINLPGGATIRDGAGDNASLSLSGLSQAGPQIDTVATMAPPTTTAPQTTSSVETSATTLTSAVGTIVDAQNNVWSLGAAVASGGFEVLKNGKQEDVGVASEVTLDNGVIWIKNPNSGTWYTYAGTYWAIQTSGPAIAAPPVATLMSDSASSFGGTVVGLATGDSVDLANFPFSNNPVIASVAGSDKAGAITDVTVKDGALSVTLALLNQHANQFALNATAYSLVADNNTPNHGTLFVATPH
jgi:beta-glucanase (GH16 family)